MHLKSLSIQNFGLFNSADLIPDQINCVKGINHDNPKDSGNGSGKSTLFKLAIIFLLYGEACGKTLNRLIQFGKKKTLVIGEVEHQGKIYKIERTVPNSLKIFTDGATEPEPYNTPSLAQEFLNSLFGDYQFFRKYCLIDDKGINLLDSLTDLRSVNSFKKELMQFITDQFTPVRDSLLKKKNNCELYSKDKKPYSYYLSKPRLLKLEDGLRNLEQILQTTQKDKELQQNTINDITVNIESSEEKINTLKLQIKNNNTSIQTKQDKKTIYESNIIELKNKKFEAPAKQDFDLEIKKIEEFISSLKAHAKTVTVNLDKSKKDRDTLIIKIHDIENSQESIVNNNKKISSDIAGLDDVQIGTKCERCGSLVSKEYKDVYRNEKVKELERNTNNLNQMKETLIELESKKQKISQEIENIQASQFKLEHDLNDSQDKLSSLNKQNLEQLESIKNIENEKNNNLTEIEKYRELIQDIEKQITELTCSNKTVQEKITTTQSHIIETSNKLASEKDCMNYYNDLYQSVQQHVQKLSERIMKFKESFKFSEYKYTPADIQLYTDSIKTLDSFSGYYIQEWINNLMFIINDLLQNINQTIELTDSKEFIKIRDNGQELLYSDLSSAQQCFLSSIFKLAILLHKGESDKIIIADDGMSAMDEVNFKNFIEICKTLPMQFFIAFQDVPEINSVNYINVERKNNISKIV